MKYSHPLVYILILNWNSARESIELYHQLETIDYTNYRIVILDNNSEMNDQNVLKEHVPQQDLLFTGINLGYGAGNNIGIKQALENDAQYVWILNPDIRIEKDTLLQLVSVLEDDRRIGAIGPRICYRKEPEKIYSDGGIVCPEKGFQSGHLHYHDTVLNCEARIIDDVGYVNGSIMLINLSAIKDIGAFREDFFLYFEETEWCLRAKRGGWKLASNTFTKAYCSASPKGKKYHYYMVRNRLWLAKIYGKYYRETKKDLWHSLWNDFKCNVMSFSLCKSLYWIKVMGFITGILITPY
ncbi:MAG: glycosyltransferase family 2 protein [bacterium]